MRHKQALILFGLAIALGLGAATAAQRWLKQQVPSVARTSVATRPVAIVQGEVPVGTVLSQAQVELVDWPAAFVPDGAFATIDALNGRVVRRALSKGEPVLEGSLMPEGSRGGLVAVLEDNKRAVSVKVDAVIGVAGFITPGSRVDVLATLRRVDLKDKLPYSKAILQDVRVLAIDQKLEEAETGKPSLVSVVTLEVNTEQAEQLTYASHEGHLQLAMRSPSDHEIVETKSTGVADLLPSRSVRRSPIRVRNTSSVEVIKGSTISSSSISY